jgi:hypothetical protein
VIARLLSRPGLTRGIHQKNIHAMQMDCRVKPGNDSGKGRCWETHRARGAKLVVE